MALCLVVFIGLAIMDHNYRPEPPTLTYDIIKVAVGAIGVATCVIIAGLVGKKPI